MRRVNFSADERVDVPDINAIGGLVEGEFRRQLGQFWMGFSIGAVMRGFEVEPESPPSTRIKVRLDRSADNVPFVQDSMAVAAENLGARIDFGVLLGGRSSDGTPEGPAQLILDFSAQVPGTYGVELRALTTESNEETRAFWDEGAKDQFVQSTKTRVVPTWEIRAVPAFSGQEWLPLAVVTWSGSTIAVSNIADRRLLLFEGTAGSFDGTTQAAAPFDFSRLPGRGTFGVGAPGPIPAIGALQRQVLDLKGQSERGVFNWYERVFPPAGGANLWGQQTKSLRTTDTVTFTIGWPVPTTAFGDYGDFNGPTGLNDCLSFIQAHASQLPRRIKIVVKNRVPSSIGVAQQFAFVTPVTIANKDLEISCDMGQAKVSRVAEPSKDVRGQAQVNCSGLPALSTALTLSGRSSLRMDNMTWAEPNSQVSLVQVTGPVYMRNTVMLGWSQGFDQFALQCHSDQTEIDQCWFAGLVNLGGGDDLIHAHGGDVRNTTFDRALIRLRTSIVNASLTAAQVLQGTAQKLRFDNCTIVGKAGLIAPSVFGVVDARGASHLTLHQCKVFHSSDENGVYLGNLIGGLDGGSVNSSDLEVGQCEFALFGDNTHGYLSGVNGLDGTGWHVFCRHDALSTSAQRTTGVSVRNNWFAGGALGAQATVDGGAVSMSSAANVDFRANRITDWVTSNGGQNILVRFSSDSGGGALGQSTGISVVDNYWGDWLGDITNVTLLLLDTVFSVQVRGNTLRRYSRTSTAAAPFSGAAISVRDLVDFWIEQNNVLGFVDVFNPATTNCNVVLSGACASGHVSANTIRDFGGIGIGAAAGQLDNMELNHNIFSPSGGSELNFAAAIDFSAVTTENMTFVGNRWSYVGGTGGTNVKTAISVGSALSFTVMANHFDKGNCHHNTLGGVQGLKTTGYAVTSPQLNYFNAYT